MNPFHIRTYHDILKFLHNPSDTQDRLQTTGQKLRALISILLIHIPLMAFCLAVLTVLNEQRIINVNNHMLNTLLQKPLWYTILLAIIITPFIEEILFRSCLRFKNNLLVHAIMSLASLTGNKNKLSTEVLLSNLWLNHFRILFYFSAFLFALVHLSNYKMNVSVVLLSPLLIAPQIIAGILISYLRVRYSFCLGFLMHSMHNATLLMMIIFTNQKS